jgi:aspartyl-tRNA(Asn)/glutamyl-tRNA(Gln) amidotransferase subunit C
MSVDSDTIREIAQLARLRVEDSELPGTHARFNATLICSSSCGGGYGRRGPMAHPLDATQPLREDRGDARNERDALQAVAPQVEDGLYLVPRVVE